MNFINLIKGIIIGIATLVPGVSGGTMAIIVGVYDDMICAVSSFFKNISKNMMFLGTLALGGVVGIVAFSKVVEFSLENFRMPTIYLFLGIILGGIPVLYKKANTISKKKSDWLYFGIGFLIILMMSLYSGTIINLATSTGIIKSLFLFLAGIVIAVALILPGISTSFLLLALGLYDMTLSAINNLDFDYLIPIILGAGFGVIATTKILEKLLNEKPRPTYMLILGFVLGSIIEVFPGIPCCLDIIVSIATFILGFVIIKIMSEKYND